MFFIRTPFSDVHNEAVAVQTRGRADCTPARLARGGWRLEGGFGKNVSQRPASKGYARFREHVQLDTPQLASLAWMPCCMPTRYTALNGPKDGTHAAVVTERLELPPRAASARREREWSRKRRS